MQKKSAKQRKAEFIKAYAEFYEMMKKESPIFPGPFMSSGFYDAVDLLSKHKLFDTNRYHILEAITRKGGQPLELFIGYVKANYDAFKELYERDFTPDDLYEMIPDNLPPF